MKILVFGTGVMANILAKSIKKPHEFVGMIEPLDMKDEKKDFDIIIDFSNHLATKDLLNFAINKKKPIVIATTGQTKEEM